MSELSIKIDNYCSLDIYPNKQGKNEAHLLRSIYVGHEDNPSFEDELSFDELLQQYINSNSIPGSPCHSLRPEHYEAIQNGLDSLLEAILVAKAKVDEMPIWKSPK